MATTINLTWASHPASEGVIKYQVFQSFNGGGFSFLADVQPSGQSTVTHQILNPNPGQYRWQYRAVNFVGNGAFGPIADGPGLPGDGGVITVVVVNS